MGVALLIAWMPWVISGVSFYVGDRREDVGRFEISSSLWTIWTSLTPIVLALHFISRSGRAWRDFGLARPSWHREFLIALVLLFLTVAGAIFANWLLIYSHLRPEPPSQHPLGLLHLAQNSEQHRFAILIFPLGIFLSVLAEELVFRAYFLARLRELWNSKIWALFVAALLFAIPHIYQGVPETFVKTIGGLLYGGAVLYWGRIWPGVIAHSLFNLWIYL